MNRFIVTTEQLMGREFLISALYDENKNMLEVIPEEKNNGSILGNIYIGRVEKIVKNLNAAFIKIGPNQSCYYSLEDFEHPIFTKKISTTKALVAGDELLVQVSKEALKTKDPVVTTNLTFAGKLAVLTTGKRQIGISSKLPAKKRDYYAAKLKEYLGEDASPDYGLIIRTNAATALDEELFTEIESLKNTCQQLLATATHKTLYSCVHQESQFWEKMMTDLRQDTLSEIVTDEPEVFAQMCRYFHIEQNQLITSGSVPVKVNEIHVSDTLTLRFHADTMISLSSLYNVKGHLDNALRERVWLKSGAYLIIQPTEALTVIDVNTGKNIAKKNVQENFLKVNKEAAIEIAKQLRLRNISGIIVVDFINMTSKAAEEELLTEFRNALKQDAVPAQLVDITRLGLVEVTRKKIKKSLLEILSQKKE